MPSATDAPQAEEGVEGEDKARKKKPVVWRGYEWTQGGWHRQASADEREQQVLRLGQGAPAPAPASAPEAAKAPEAPEDLEVARINSTRADQPAAVQRPAAAQRPYTRRAQRGGFDHLRPPHFQGGGGYISVAEAMAEQQACRDRRAAARPLLCTRCPTTCDAHPYPAPTPRHPGTLTSASCRRRAPRRSSVRCTTGTRSSGAPPSRVAATTARAPAGRCATAAPRVPRCPPRAALGRPPRRAPPPPRPAARRRDGPPARRRRTRARCRPRFARRRRPSSRRPAARALPRP